MSRIADALKLAEQIGVHDLPRIPLPDPFAVSAPQDRASSVPALTMPRPATSTPVAAPALSTAKLNVRVEPWAPKSRSLIDFATDFSIGAEAFRTLRSRLHQIRSRRALRTLLVTSASAGEGKTFVAANLASAMSQQPGTKTLVIDCDLRRPRIHELFGAQLSGGVSEYLNGELSEADIIQHDGKGNLFLITAGALMKQAPELLGSDRLKSLIHTVAEQFDYVIIDSPPALPVSDSSVISDFCDGVLFVVAAGQTAIAAATNAIEEFAQNAIVGVIVNRAEGPNASAGYYRRM